MGDGLFDLGGPEFRGGWVDVRIVGYETARKWIEQYHYSHVAPSSCTYWGLFDGDLLAVVGVGAATNDHGIAGKFGLEAWRGNTEVRRVAVHPDAPANTASRCVRLVLREITAQGIEWVYSYADTGQNHHGGIYQALGAVYVGMSPAVYGWLLNGEPIHPRSVVARYGTNARHTTPALAAERGEHLEYVADMNTPKHTYILPTARSRAVRASIREHLARYAQPYPKRAVAASSDAADFHSAEGGSQPTLPLHSKDVAA